VLNQSLPTLGNSCLDAAQDCVKQDLTDAYTTAQRHTTENLGVVGDQMNWLIFSGFVICAINLLLIWRVVLGLLEHIRGRMRVSGKTISSGNQASDEARWKWKYLGESDELDERI
jgi:hypothetical protein